MPAWWTPWSRLSRWGQLRRAAAIAFTTWHLVAMVAMGASPKVRRQFAPVFAVYNEKLKLTNTWGMFSKRPSSTHVRVEALDADGSVWLLATSEVDDKGLLQRFRDARLRKIQTKLGNQKDRLRMAKDYLDGWCRLSGQAVPEVREVRAIQSVHELRDDRNRISRKAEERVLERRTCGAGKPRSLPVEVKQEDDEEGEDT
jgi:hypothetical protein